MKDDDDDDEEEEEKGGGRREEKVDDEEKVKRNWTFTVEACKRITFWKREKTLKGSFFMVKISIKRSQYCKLTWLICYKIWKNKIT